MALEVRRGISFLPKPSGVVNQRVARPFSCPDLFFERTAICLAFRIGVYLLDIFFPTSAPRPAHPVALPADSDLPLFLPWTTGL